MEQVETVSAELRAPSCLAATMVSMGRAAHFKQISARGLRSGAGAGSVHVWVSIIWMASVLNFSGKAMLLLVVLNTVVHLSFIP